MAPYRRAYSFTGEPNANEDAADWLYALETNIYSCMTDREKVDLFSSKLWRGSPAKEWFNKLPDEGHQLWHSAKQEFESRWCKTLPFLEKDTNDHYATSHASATLPPYSVPLKDPLPILSKLLAAQDAPGVFDFCQQTANSEHRNFALVWDLAFRAGNSFAKQENASRKEPAAATSEIMLKIPSSPHPSADTKTIPIPPPTLTEITTVVSVPPSLLFASSQKWY